MLSHLGLKTSLRNAQNFYLLGVVDCKHEFLPNRKLTATGDHKANFIRY